MAKRRECGFFSRHISSAACNESIRGVTRNTLLRLNEQIEICYSHLGNVCNTDSIIAFASFSSYSTFDPVHVTRIAMIYHTFSTLCMRRTSISCAFSRCNYSPFFSSSWTTNALLIFTPISVSCDFYLLTHIRSFLTASRCCLQVVS